MSKCIHCIVDCLTCGKRWEGVNGQAVGKKHAVKYGHNVSGEIAYGFHYDYTKLQIKQIKQEETKQ